MIIYWERFQVKKGTPSSSIDDFPVTHELEKGDEIVELSGQYPFYKGAIKMERKGKAMVNNGTRSAVIIEKKSYVVIDGQLFKIDGLEDEELFEEIYVLNRERYPDFDIQDVIRTIERLREKHISLLLVGS